MTRLVLAMLLVVGLRLVGAASFPLLHNEAYHWEWSRHPAASYIENPPMVAWMIRLFSIEALRQSELGLRVGPLVAGLASAAGICWLCWRLFDDKQVVTWTIVFFFSLPIFHAVGMLALPEAPLLLFYLIFLLAFWQATQTGGLATWLLAGAAVGLAVLCKLEAVLIPLAAVTFLGISPADRHWLRRKEPFVAGLAAIAVLCPFLYWEYRHGWPSVSYRLWIASHAHFPKTDGLWEFPIEQLANAGLFLLLPVFASPFFRTSCLPRQWRSPFLFVKIQFLTLGTVFFASALLLETHPQTTLLAYPAAVICLAVVWVQVPTRFITRRLRLLVRCNAVALILVATLLLVGLDHLKRTDVSRYGEYLEAKGVIARQRLFGWPQIAQRLQRERSLRFGHNARLFTHNFELASLTSFYGQQETIINLVPLALREPVGGCAQESYVPYQELVGQSGIYFGEETGPSADGLRAAFEHVEELEPVEIKYEGRLLKRYRVCRVDGLKRGVVNSR